MNVTCLGGRTTTANCTGSLRRYHLKQLQVNNQYVQNRFLGTFGTDIGGDAWETDSPFWTKISMYAVA